MGDADIASGQIFRIQTVTADQQRIRDLADSGFGKQRQLIGNDPMVGIRQARNADNTILCGQIDIALIASENFTHQDGAKR